MESDKKNLEIPIKKKSRFWVWFFVLGMILIGIAGALVFKTGFTLSQMNAGGAISGILPKPYEEPMPQKDPDRLNILLLGYRGADDPNGGLLTDTIMLLSIKKSTNQAAIFSIPRDLYMVMPSTGTQNDKPAIKEKINFAYVMGEEKKAGAGLVYSKAAVSQLTGLYIDYAVSVNFAAFKEIINVLGGVDIYLDKPFIESQQWVNGGDAGASSAFFIKTETASSSEGIITTQKWVFEIPSGNYHLEGNTALYYMRARYSSNDFDRARRQQQVLLAVKEKAMTLGVLANPVKLFKIMDSLGGNIKMDMAVSDITDLLSLYSKLDIGRINHKVFDITPQGLLYDTKSPEGAYILLPVGDNYDKIREACKNIFN